MKETDEMPRVPCPNCGKANLVRNSKEDRGWCNQVCFLNYKHANRDVRERYEP